MADLHERIRNIRHSDPRHPTGETWPVDFLNGHELGFHDARKAAAELAASIETENATLREALTTTQHILTVLRPDYFRAIHDSGGACDLDYEVCEQCGAAGDPPPHADGCFSAIFDAALDAARTALSTVDAAESGSAQKAEGACHG